MVTTDECVINQWQWWQKLTLFVIPAAFPSCFPVPSPSPPQNPSLPKRSKIKPDYLQNQLGWMMISTQTAWKGNENKWVWAEKGGRIEIQGWSWWKRSWSSFYENEGKNKNKLLPECARLPSGGRVYPNAHLQLNRIRSEKKYLLLHFFKHCVECLMSCYLNKLFGIYFS